METWIVPGGSGFKVFNIHSDTNHRMISSYAYCGVKAQQTLPLMETISF
jgi:hypothetical protein